MVGTAPLFSVAIALVFLDEPLQAGLIAGAILIVAGGLLLVSERDRPEHVRVLGLAFALAATVVFAVRDNFVRWLAIDTDVAPGPAAIATLFAGAALIAALPPGDASAPAARDAARASRPRASSSASRTSPLRGVLPRAGHGRLAARRHRVAVGRRCSRRVLGDVGAGRARLVAGALLVVCGGVLIGAFR